MMKRIFTIVMSAALALGMVAGPALAQRPPDRPPPQRPPAAPPGQPPDRPPAYPPGRGAVANPNARVATPGADIAIRGRNWGPNTVVEITRRPQPGAPATQSVGFAEVGPDGTFSATVTAPADATEGSTLAFELQGVDAAGFTQTQVMTFDVVRHAAAGAAGAAASSSTSAASGSTAGSSSNVSPLRASPVSALTVGNGLLAAALAMGMAALWFGPLRRRRRLVLR
jgi:hypothetical protein